MYHYSDGPHDSAFTTRQNFHFLLPILCAYLGRTRQHAVWANALGPLESPGAERFPICEAERHHI